MGLPGLPELLRIWLCLMVLKIRESGEDIEQNLRVFSGRGSAAESAADFSRNYCS